MRAFNPDLNSGLHCGSLAKSKFGVLKVTVHSLIPIQIQMAAATNGYLSVSFFFFFFNHVGFKQEDESCPYAWLPYTGERHKKNGQE